MNKRLNKNLILLILIVVSILFLIRDVNALGVTPGRTTVDFKPNLQQTVEFTVLNSEHKDFRAVIFVEGDLAGYVTLYNYLIEFRADEGSKTFKYDFKLPATLEKPGINSADIIIRELPEQKGKDIFIGTSIAVVTQLYVKVPYPGKYAEVDLRISEANVNENVNFFIQVSNFGTEDINKISAIIEILGPTNELIATVETSEIAIKSKERAELTASWLADVNPGKYYAVAKVKYDGKSARAETVFNVGGLLLEIIDISVKDFKLGQVAKFDILVQNRANEILENVFAEMVIKENNVEIAKFKSANENIESLAEKELNAFWDTTGIKEGSYDATLILNYKDKSIKKELKTFVTLTSIETSFLGTGKAVAAGKGLRRETMIFLLVITLILINIGWFVYFKKRGKNLNIKENRKI